jgi:hypothetical protein
MAAVPNSSAVGQTPIESELALTTERPSRDGVLAGEKAGESDSSALEEVEFKEGGYGW